MTMTSHLITIDEGVDPGGGAMFKAYCTDECGWQGDRWHHADEYADRVTEHPDDAAHDAAVRDSDDHFNDLEGLT